MNPVLWRPRPEAAARTQIAELARKRGFAGAACGQSSGAGRSSSRPRSGRRSGSSASVKASRDGGPGAVDGDADAGRPLVRRRAAQLRREPAAPRRRQPAPDLRRRGRPPARAVLGRAAGRRCARSPPRSRADGVGVGDRVAGYLPNIPETIVAMLATTALGAVWSSCLARFRRRGRARPLRPDRAQGADRGRRLPLCRQADRHPEQGRRRSPTASPASLRDGAGAVPRAGRRCPDRSPTRSTWTTCTPTAPAAGVRPAALRPSALHPLFLRHDRHAQGDRPRRRRHAAPAHQGAPAALPTRGRASGSSTSRPAAG